MKRMYHPSLDSFVDVPDKDADSWAESGWRKSAKKDVHQEDSYPEVGEHPGFATIPVLEDTSPTVTGTAAATTTSSSGAARSGSGTRSTATGSATSSGSAATT